MKKKTIIAVVLLAALFAGYKFYSARKNGKTVIYFPVVSAQGEIKNIVDTTGKLEPLNRVEVNPSVVGRVDKILVEEGDKVTGGQILAYVSSNDRVAILDAAKARGEESFAKWKEAYKPTPVLSPLKGKVIKRGVVEGETVSTTTVMFALSDDLIAVAQVDEADIGKVKEGQKALITLDAYPDEEVSGRVFQILNEGVAVSNVITYSVKIRLDRIPAYFKSEMSASIKIVADSRKNAVLLPMSAVAEKDDGARYVYKGDINNPKPVLVKTGLEDGDNVEIISGVEERETVFVRANGYIPQTKAESSNPFMPSRPKGTKNSPPPRI